MKTSLISVLAVALTLTPCWAGPREDLKAAVGKLAEAPNYSWTTATELEGAQWRPGTVSGKAEKGGYAVIKQERDGNVTTAVVKGERGVVQTDDGWKTAEELRASAQGGGGGGGAMRGAVLLRTRPPADEAAHLLEKVKELKMADGVISGDLTEEGAKELMMFGRRGGGGGGQFPEPKNTKGWVKCWVKDGQLTKMQVQVSGTYSRNGEDRDMTRTSTHELKDIGTTKLEVPEEARKKLAS